jgi:hypothetical protein
MSKSSSERLGVVALLAAAISLPVLWLVILGVVAVLHISPRKRWLGRRMVAEWGGWSRLPTAAAAWTWQRLRVRPYAVLTVAGFVAVVSAIIGGFEWVPLGLAVATVVAMILPAVDEHDARLFTKAGQGTLRH